MCVCVLTDNQCNSVLLFLEADAFVMSHVNLVKSTEWTSPETTIVEVPECEDPVLYVIDGYGERQIDVRSPTFSLLVGCD